jgi:hypothetical protein
MEINTIKFDKSIIQPLVEDFETFMDYIDKNNPKLTKKGEVLGKKILFELNEKMIYKKEVESPTLQQMSYPLISLLFELCLGSKIFIKQADEKGNLYLKPTHRKEEYSILNVYEKYIFLLEIYWTNMDFDIVFGEGCSLYELYSIKNILQVVADNNEGDIIAKGTFSGREDDDRTYRVLTPIIYHMAFFGFWDYKEIEYKDKKPTTFDDKFEYVELKSHGIQMCKILSEERLLEDWNIPFLKYKFDEYGLEVIPGRLIELNDRIFDDRGAFHKIIEEYNEEMKDKYMFLEPFKDIFPKDALSKTVESQIIPDNIEGNFVFKVSLSSRIWRKIKLSHKHTLYDMHMEIQEAFNFDNDHLYTFYMDGKRSRKNYFNSDMCSDGPFVHQAVIGELGLYIGKRILYLFDYGDMWQFNVNLVEILNDEKEISVPRVIESKGEAPEQYGDFW